jgi:hypothetical protein
MTLRHLLPLALLSLAAVHCAAEDGAEAPLPSEDDLVTVNLPDRYPSVLLKEPGLMTRLESRLSFAAVMGGSGKSGAELARTSATYRALQAAVSGDVDEVKRADRLAGVGLAFSHRTFDPAWLSANETRFELVGVANRLDLRHQALGACGELHLVYRLAYTTQDPDPERKVDSRLPFTVNVLVPQGDDGSGCRTVANQWIDAGGREDALLRGPLKSAALGAARQAGARIELNYQLVRWPSSVRPDMGGHAEYKLRVFDVAGDTLRPRGLEDTPRTNLSAADKAELRAVLKANVTAIDQGTFRLPEKFQDDHAVSVAPRGAARAGNRPYAQLFKGDTFADFGLAGTQRVQSAQKLLHRLDGATCIGCHQSRGIAGFHLLGEERNGLQRLNALMVGASPHLLETAAWREGYVRAVAAGNTPSARPFADFVPGKTGAYGSHCSLGSDPAFKEFTCSNGLTCKAVDGSLLGVCLPSGQLQEGDSVEQATVTQTADPHDDRVNAQRQACTSGRAAYSSDGFPNGMCHNTCTTIGTPAGEGRVCAGLPFGSNPVMRALGGFNQCLASKPFRYCLVNDQTPTIIRSCDPENPCRDDYVCARVYVPREEGVSSYDPQKGVCMPPYFLFQGRVDGHKVSSR